MTNPWRAAFVLLLLVPGIARADEVQELISRGAALHDEGRDEEAIAVYRQVLQKEPRNEVALYELGYSLSSAGRLDECVDTAKKGLKVGQRLRAGFYTLAGNCLDMAGRTKKAVDYYRRGLEEYPTDGQLALDFAVAQGTEGKYKEACRLLKIAITSRPLHASAHPLLAKSYGAAGYSVPALLAAIRFLTFEPEGERAREAAALARDLLNQGVTRESETEITAQVNPDASKDEGDFTAVAMGVALSSAARFTEELEGKSEMEHLARQTSDLISFLGDLADSETKSSFPWKTYVPLLLSIQRDHLEEALAYRVFSSLELPGTQEWTQGHSEAMAKLDRLLEDAGGAAG